MPDIPGTPDRHLTITPEMQRRPLDEILMEMADHVEESVSELLEDGDEDARIHVAVTVRLGVEQRTITMALSGKAKNVSAKLRARQENERICREHVAADEAVIYALQMTYQLRDAESEERRDEIFRPCTPILEQKADALMDLEEEGNPHDILNEPIRS
jgi:hypothetical protein